MATELTQKTREKRYSLLKAFHNQQYNEVRELLFNEHVIPQCRVRDTKRTPMHYACQYGWFDIVKELLEKHNRNPEAKDANEETPLHHTCQSNSPQAPYIVKYLLKESGCNSECKNKDGLTPIQVTPIENTNIIRMLVENGAHPNETDRRGDSLLHKACKNKCFTSVKCLLKAKCDPNCKNKDGLTPIQVIAIESPDIVRELIKHGANPNVVYPDDGNTLLHYACRYASLPLLKCLLEMKCNPDIKNDAGESPLHVVTVWKEESYEFVKELVDSGGADPNSQDNLGNTLLHYACKNAGLQVALKCFNYLLECKQCDPNCRNKNGLTPIQDISKNQYLKWMIDQLIKKGANVNVADSNCDTLLHKACKSGEKLIVEQLLNANCNVDCRNKDGNTPLLVTDPTKTDIIKHLITKGASVNIQNDNGDTLLHTACKFGQLQTVKYVLKNRCNPNPKNKAGHTPLQVIPLTHPEAIAIIKKIIKSGGDPNAAAQDDGNSLLHRACSLRDKELMLETVKCLLDSGFDPSEKNEADLIPCQITNDFKVIELMLRYGANPDDVYKTHGKVLKQPLQSPIKVFVAGNPRAGKSTLTTALKKEQSTLARTFSIPRKVTGVDQSTAGVVPHDYKSKDFGNIIIYDLAGHPEFYGSHAALMENTILSTPPIFILVIDLRDKEDEIFKVMSYWLSFLENQCASLGGKTHIIIIGSHADELGQQERKHKLSILSQGDTVDSFSDNFTFVEFIAMDCQYSDSTGMRTLRQCLKVCCKELREQKKYSDVSFNSHCVHSYLLEHMKDSAYVTLAKLITHLISEYHTGRCKTITRFIPTNLHALVKVCVELNDKGHIMFLKDPDNIKESWIVIDKQVLLTEVTGSIFSPEKFSQHKTITQCVCSTGVVPLSSIADQFPKHNTKMLVIFLSQLEYCHEISDKTILDSITMEHHSCGAENGAASNDPTERYFLFPALVSVDAPDNIWEPKPQFTHFFGWILKCCNHKAIQYFTSRFLQVLLLRLTFSFSTISTDLQMRASSPSLQRKCSIWKNGILWGNKHGIETIVEVTPDKKCVLLLMRCPESGLFQLCQLRSQVIQEILKAAKSFCSQLETNESFIEPSQIIKDYPLQIPELQLYSIADIAKASLETVPSVAVVDKSGNAALLENLVLYEPYAGLGRSVVRKLHRNSDIQGNQANQEKVSNYFLEKIAQCVLKNNPKFFIKLIHKEDTTYEKDSVTVHYILELLKSWRNECPGTYQNLAERLNQCSVYAGRNLLDQILADVPMSSSDSEAGSDANDIDGFPKSKRDGKPALHDLQVMYDRHNGEELVRVIDEVAAQWEELAIALQFEIYDIERIRRDNQQNAKAACQKILMEWLNEERIQRNLRKPVTWGTLIQSLADANLKGTAKRIATALHLNFLDFE